MHNLRIYNTFFGIIVGLSLMSFLPTIVLWEPSVMTIFLLLGHETYV